MVFTARREEFHTLLFSREFLCQIYTFKTSKSNWLLIVRLWITGGFMTGAEWEMFPCGVTLGKGIFHLISHFNLEIFVV